MAIRTMRARIMHAPRSRVRLGTVLTYVVLLLGLSMTLTPFLWMIGTSIKPRWEALVMPPVWIPSELVWSNYLVPLREQPVLLWFQNTVILVVFRVLGVSASSSCATSVLAGGASGRPGRACPAMARAAWRSASVFTLKKLSRSRSNLSTSLSSTYRTRTNGKTSAIRRRPSVRSLDI